eukprot:31480-Pelagococcus_subviridis.AAC.6
MAATPSRAPSAMVRAPKGSNISVKRRSCVAVVHFSSTREERLPSRRRPREENRATCTEKRPIPVYPYVYQSRGRQSGVRARANL